jgi:hypothetical protein
MSKSENDQFSKFIKTVRENDFTNFSSEISKTMSQTVKEETAKLTKK